VADIITVVASVSEALLERPQQTRILSTVAPRQRHVVYQSVPLLSLLLLFALGRQIDPAGERLRFPVVDLICVPFTAYMRD